jgi:NADH-quinone oxidoreductase subunit E/NADP-reducing hydrogenase subunit HndA
MDSNSGGQDGHTNPDLSGVRSGDLVSREERSVLARAEDSSAITHERAIPPAEITSILDRYRHVDPEEAMIPVFQEIQNSYGYVTQAAADQVCMELDLPEADVYGVLTFYSFFRYTPRAGHVIMSCEGTGCYVRGAANVRAAIEKRLSVGPGDTTRDGHWTFEPQSICLGACDLAPLVEIEGRYYAHVTPEKMDAIIAEWEGAGENIPVGDNMTGGPPHQYEENHGFGPRVEELYAGYEVERYMTEGAPKAAATMPGPALSEAIQNTPPTPKLGGAEVE